MNINILYICTACVKKTYTHSTVQCTFCKYTSLIEIFKDSCFCLTIAANGELFKTKNVSVNRVCLIKNEMLLNLG